MNKTMASFTYIRWNGSLLVADRGGVAALETTAKNEDELAEHLGRDLAKKLTEQLADHTRDFADRLIRDQLRGFRPTVEDGIAPAVLDFEEM